MAKLLLRYGATVDMAAKGATPLISGAMGGYTAVCEAILLPKVDVDQYGRPRSTPLFKAVVKSNVDMVKRLLRYGAQVDLPKIFSGETLLMHSELEKYIEVCEELLHHKANISK